MPDVQFRFDGKVVLISGAARGIGRQLVLQFLEAGAAVIAVDRDEEGLEETKKMAGPPFLGRVMDIRSAESIQELMQVIDSTYGNLHACINNAAVAPHESLDTYRDSLWDSVYSINCKGTFLMTQAAGRYMREKGIPGRIVNFSSGAALKGGQGSAAYASSRAAVEGFSRVAAIELAPYGILVNTVRPGLIDTQPKPLPPVMREQLSRRIPQLPLRRPGKPEEVGNAVMFLASSLSGYMTGSVITVDGGASIGTFPEGEVIDEDSRYSWLSSDDAIV